MATDDETEEVVDGDVAVDGHIHRIQTAMVQSHCSDLHDPNHFAVAYLVG